MQILVDKRSPNKCLKPKTKQKISSNVLQITIIQWLKSLLLIKKMGWVANATWLLNKAT